MNIFIHQVISSSFLQMSTLSELRFFISLTFAHLFFLQMGYSAGSCMDTAGSIKDIALLQMNNDMDKLPSPE